VPDSCLIPGLDIQLDILDAFAVNPPEKQGFASAWY